VLVEPSKRENRRSIGARVNQHGDGAASADIEPSATLGPNTRVWRFAHVMSGAHIGANCTLGQGVFVAGTVVIGDACKVQNNVSLYDGLTLEDEVFLGPSCVFTNVKHPRAAISRRHAFERTLVRHGATVGANATIVCGVTIGRYAMVGAGAVVSHDVPDHALVVGVPARRAGWVGRRGVPLVADPAGDEWVCPESGARHRLVDGTLMELAGG
jgi:UDP-2-acetamido-3-amino-2,3-dideoxy-glucuronate N-acetyltransferase